MQLWSAKKYRAKQKTNVNIYNFSYSPTPICILRLQQKNSFWWFEEFIRHDIVRITYASILLHLYGLIISVESLVPQLPSKGCVLDQHRTICPPISAENFLHPNSIHPQNWQWLILCNGPIKIRKWGQLPLASWIFLVKTFLLMFHFIVL